MTKKLKTLTVTFMWACAIFMVMGLQACSDDDDYSVVDNQNPTISLSTNHIQTEPGRLFTIAGQIDDKDGIKSIRLQNDGMYLDKTIDLLELYKDSLIYSYALQYSYTAEKTWADADSYPVVITVEDVVGNMATATVTVTPDGDFTDPVFTSAPSASITVIKQNPVLNLNASVSDNKVLDHINISIPSLNINDDIKTTATSTYKLTTTYTFPETETTYEMTMTVYDTFGNSTSTVSTISVSEMPDFDKMYLADVTDAADLVSDVYGVPMLIDHVDAYQYRARYYNQKAGTTVRFIPQMTDFEPICFGIDPEDNGKLINSPSSALGIQLDKVGYYQIDINIVTNEYSVSTYTPTDEVLTVNGTTTVNFNDGSGDQPAQICLAGAGLPAGYGNWTTNQNADAYILLQSTENPYLLYREDTWEEGSEVEFTISQTHWWGWWPEPYWRFDGSDYNEKNVKNGGDNMKKVKVPATGTYRFEFDYHLLRSRLIPVK